MIVTQEIVLNGPGDARFLELLKEVWETKHSAKAAGYGDRNSGDFLANLRASEELGIPPAAGAWIRALDKRHRISQAFRHLGTERSVASVLGHDLWRKVRSDLLELAAYCLLIVILAEEER